MKSPPWTTRDATILVPARRSDVVLEELDGEVLCADPRTQSTYHLNETAQLVWSHCDGRTATLHIVEQITRRYEIDPDDALDDVEQVVTFFAESGLLEEPSGGAEA